MVPSERIDIPHICAEHMEGSRGVLFEFNMKNKIEKSNKEFFQMEITEEYLKGRVKFICDGDKYIVPLRNLIGKAHGWDPDKVEKKRFTKEFEGFVLSYLKR